MTRPKTTTIDLHPSASQQDPPRYALLETSAEFKEFLTRRRIDLTRQVDDLDAEIAAATRAHNDWLAERRRRHADLTYVLAQCDAALAVEPLGEAVERPAPTLSQRTDMEQL